MSNHPQGYRRNDEAYFLPGTQGIPPAVNYQQPTQQQVMAVPPGAVHAQHNVHAQSYPVVTTPVDCQYVGQVPAVVPPPVLPAHNTVLATNQWDSSMQINQNTDATAEKAPTSKKAKTSKKVKESPGEQESRLEKRRRDCKINQRKYRQRLKNKSNDFEKKLNLLRDTVKGKEFFRSAALSHVLIKQSGGRKFLVDFARQYCETFSHGMGFNAVDRLQKISFINAVTDPNQMTFSEFSNGRLELVRQWDYYTQLHEKVALSLTGIVPGPEDSSVVKVDCDFNLILKRDTITSVYPHLVEKESLIQEMVGKEILVPCRLFFYFNSAGQVVRFDTELDYLTAWRKVFGNLDRPKEILGAGRYGHSGLFQFSQIDRDRSGVSTVSDGSSDYLNLLPAQDRGSSSSLTGGAQSTSIVEVASEPMKSGK